MTDETTIECAIQAKNLNAPRVRPQDLDDAIVPLVAPQYHRFQGTTVTVCCLTLRNGFTVIGESAAVSLENFDEEIGRQVAYDDARNKLWPLLGYYALKDRLVAEHNATARVAE